MAPRGGRVRLGRFSLDRALARGEDPSLSRRLTQRARELCRRRTRGALAAHIERVVEDADKPPRMSSAAVPLNRRAIRALRALLLTLAWELRTEHPVRAHGVAIVRQLLRDGCSPLYGAGRLGELEEELRRARAGLMPV